MEACVRKLFTKVNGKGHLVKAMKGGEHRLEVFLVKSGGFKNSLEQCFTVFLKKICFQ